MSGATERPHSAPPPEEYPAPTFSWGDLDGEVVLQSKPGIGFVTRSIASAAFIKHRDGALYSAATKTMRSELGSQILTDHIFEPLTSPKVEVRVRGNLRSCQRVPTQLVPEMWPMPEGNSCARPSKNADVPAKSHCFDADIAMLVEFDRASDENGQSDSTVYYYTVIQTFMEEDLAGRHGFDGAQGLFLKSVDASMGRFERLGLVAYCGDQQADICQPLGNERDLPAWMYDETTGEHTFYIF